MKNKSSGREDRLVMEKRIVAAAPADGTSILLREEGSAPVPLFHTQWLKAVQTAYRPNEAYGIKYYFSQSADP